MSQAQLDDFRNALEQAREHGSEDEAIFEALVTADILNGDVEDVENPTAVALAGAETLSDVEKIILEL